MRDIYLVFPCLCFLFVVSRFFGSGLAIFTCFSGEIPECLMKFIDLKHLTLNNNYLHGSIPELPAESQLVILALHRNQLTGTITESLQRLQQLAVLTLHDPLNCRNFPKDLTLPPKISSKWRVCLGFSTKNEIILVVTGTVWGVDPRFFEHVFLSFLETYVWQTNTSRVDGCKCESLNFRMLPTCATHPFYCVPPQFFFPQWKWGSCQGLRWMFVFLAVFSKHHPKKEQTPMVSSACFLSI